jgi:hypothetical protein
MSLQRIWALSYDSKLIDVMRNSKNAIPIIQAFHLLGIALLLGAMLLLNIRLLGIGFREIPLRVISNQVWSWGTGGLLLAMASGILVFIPDPARYAANHSFVTKMAVLIVVVVFQFTLYRRAVQAQQERVPPRRLLILPTISLVLWFTVAWAGRLIAFLG